MHSIHTYLSSVQANKAAATSIVLGNEAADLDSIVSSIVYGYLLSRQSPESVVLPLMPIPRAEFKLRSEVVYVFKEAGIASNELVFFDEVDFAHLMRSGTGLVLVDHNRLGLALHHYGANVVAVLDHHKDEGLYCNADPRIIRTMGSTATLVGLEFRDAKVAFTEEIALLLGGAILLDTVNLDEKAGRVTAADIEIAETVLPLCPLPREEYFDNLQRAKYSVAGLDTAELLRKDYKEYQFEGLRCGIASALLAVSQWREMDGDLFTGFADFAARRHLDVLISMNAFTDPEFSRDLILYSTTEEAHDSLLACLGLTSLGLQQYGDTVVESHNGGCLSCYCQKNLDISRKKLYPLLREYY